MTTVDGKKRSYGQWLIVLGFTFILLFIPLQFCFGQKTTGGNDDFRAIISFHKGRIREAPKLKSPIIFTLARGAEVFIREEREPWYLVADKSGRTGWIHRIMLSGLPPADKSVKPDQKTVIASKKKPAPSVKQPDISKKTDQIQKTEPVVVAEVSKDNTAATISVDKGRVRKAPSMKSPVQFTLPYDTEVMVKETKEPWYFIADQSGRTGWAHRIILYNFRPYQAPAALAKKMKPTKTSIQTPKSIVKKDEMTAAIIVNNGRVRKSPSLKAPINFTLKRGETVVIQGEKDPWFRIADQSGRTGWAHRIILSDVKAALEPVKADDKTKKIVGGKTGQKTATIAVNRGRVRKSPSLKAPINFTLKRGETVVIQGEKDPWFRIADDSGRTGWAHRIILSDVNAALEPVKTDDKTKKIVTGKTDQKTATIAVNSGRVRQSPSLKAPINFTLKRGETVVIQGEKDPWFRIADKSGRTGWAHRIILSDVKAALEPVKTDDKTKKIVDGKTGQKTATIAVNRGRVRKSPSLKAPINFTLKRGETVVIQEEKDPWFRIADKSGRTGWAHRIILKDISTDDGKKNILSNSLSDVRITVVNNKRTDVFFQLTGQKPPKTIVLHGDLPRVVCDFFNTTISDKFRDSLKGQGSMVKQIRFGKHLSPKQKIRAVVDLFPGKDYKIDQIWETSKKRYILHIQTASSE